MDGRLKEIRGKTIEKVVADLRPIDDTFFSKLIEQKEFCQELLRIILKKENLVVLKITTQKNLRNIKAKSVVLDVLCVDLENKYYNIEVQRADNDNHQKRARYNISNIDTYIAEKGTNYKDLPDIYVVYISEFDVFKKGKTIYHIRRIVEETGDMVDNGIHEVYVNTKVDDHSDIAELMKIFKSEKVPNNKKFPNICRTIRNFKEEKGSGNMCKIVDDYAKEYAKEHVEEYAGEYAKEYAEEYVKRFMTVILEMKNGISEEELINRGYEQALIQNAKIALG